MAAVSNYMREAFEPATEAQSLLSMSIGHLSMCKAKGDLSPCLAKALELMSLAFLEFENARGEPPPSKADK